MKKTTRREFVRGSLAGAASLLVAGTGARAYPYARVRGANEDIRIGTIGVGSNVKIGGKGKADIRDFLKIPGVRVVALCDVDSEILGKQADKMAADNQKVATYADVRKMLDSKDIDAVSITTPNHWHALDTVWACQAGKDVYVQKPASHNIFEGRKMVEAARKYKRIVYSTSGPRGATGLAEAFAYARQGHLGKILYAHGLNYKPRQSIGKVSGQQKVPDTVNYDLWSGPAPVVPLMREYLHYDWHWNWYYGNGDLGNMGIHYMDACRMALAQPTLPRHVLSVGGRFGYDDDGETPNTMITFLDYKPAPIIFEVRGLPKGKQYQDNSWNKSMDRYHNVSIGAIVRCEHGYIAQNKAYDRSGKLLKTFEPTNKDGKSNFIDAVRSRRVSDLQSDVLEGHLSAALVHMANISYRTGATADQDEIAATAKGSSAMADAYERFAAHLDANEIDVAKTPVTLGAALTMDPDKERFVGALSRKANRLVSREYRKPFVVPTVV